MTIQHQMITKKQVRDQMIKKILAIGIPSVLVVGGLITFLVMYFFVNTAMMNPQVNFTYGDCQYRTGPGQPWQRAEVALSFTAEYTFKTGKGALMDLLLQDRTVVRITEKSLLEVKSLNSSAIELSMKRGTAFGKIKKLFKRQNLKIQGPTVVASVRGTEFSFVGSRGYCIEGSIAMSRTGKKGSPVLIEKNMKSDLAAGSPGAEKMTPEEIKSLRTVIDSIRLTRVLIVTRRLLFGLGSADLTPALEKELEGIYHNLKDVEGTIRIIGHTDNTGLAGVNKSLSLKRAQAISDFLAAKGIPRQRLTAEGRGDIEPIALNSTEKGRRANRRVEFVLDEE